MQIMAFCSRPIQAMLAQRMPVRKGRMLERCGITLHAEPLHDGFGQSRNAKAIPATYCAFAYPT